jgi:hypothetical protein
VSRLASRLENAGSSEPIWTESARTGHGISGISITWENSAMASDARSADADGPDKLLRPAWEDTADETEADRFALPRQARATAGWGGGWLDRATPKFDSGFGKTVLRQ